ncbi:MAG: hypothetical protein A3J74_00060 [Elusimicrobia bacterium RIFCSPHIGHO2_02_FULL_57_9]|nr:MAG: hypothetical protein A3J74_00060 [Elusimicrobia bacterium RIFCSPHIGHO2_02_FULL_57_9]
MLAARAIAGAVLAFSGTLKAAGPAEEFALVIQYYQIVSPEMALSLATFLPWIELLIGLCLLTGYFTRQASAAAGGLFLMFIIALGSALARGFQLPNCGCFGAGWHPSMSTTILMDTGLLLLCALAYVKKDSPLSLDHWCEKIS